MLIEELKTYARSVWGVETKDVYRCPNCNFNKDYSKHDEEIYCPGDGRKLKQGIEVIDEYEQRWYSKLQALIAFPWEIESWDTQEALPKNNVQAEGE
jgi:hypothetical protein